MYQQATKKNSQNRSSIRTSFHSTFCYTFWDSKCLALITLMLRFRVFSACFLATKSLNFEVQCQKKDCNLDLQPSFKVPFAALGKVLFTEKTCVASIGESPLPDHDFPYSWPVWPSIWKRCAKQDPKCPCSQGTHERWPWKSNSFLSSRPPCNISGGDSPWWHVARPDASQLPGQGYFPNPEGWQQAAQPNH